MDLARFLDPIVKGSHGLQIPSLSFIQVFAILCLYLLLRSAYRLTLHPLSRFPGPKLWAISHIPWAYWVYTGFLHQKQDELHQKYGPVVRMTPDTLLFFSVKGMEDIFRDNHKLGGCPKSEFYDCLSIKLDPKDRNMLTQLDLAVHAQTRKAFAPNFSKASLKQQEPYIQSHVATLMSQFRAHRHDQGGIELHHWLTLLGFDVVSELAFGEAFGGVATGVPHMWIQQVDKTFLAASFFDIMRRYTAVSWMIKPLKALITRKNSAPYRMVEYSRDLTLKRLKNEPPEGRTDFFTGIIEEGRSFLTLEQLRLNGSSFVIAASHTTIHVMVSMMYFMLKNPRTYKKLVDEIRASFKDASEITLENIELPYLGAVIDEAMRIYQPVTMMGYRTCPGRLLDRYFVPKGVEVTISPFTLTHSEENYKQPFEFIPERWLTNENNDTLRASQPFSLGPRNCLGRYMALLEIKLFYCHLFFEFDVEPRNPEEFAKLDWIATNKSYILWDKYKLPVLFKDRKVDL